VGLPGDSSVSYVQQRDDELFGYLSQYAGKALTTALFHAPDTLADPCAVMAIPINDMAPAQQSFREWITSLPADTLGQLLPSRMYLRVQQQNLVCWRLPRTTLFARFTGITRPGLNPVVCFYDNRMFWAPDVRSLSAYIEFMLRKEVLQGKTAYEEAVSGMAPSYQYMLMADLADVFRSRLPTCAPCRRSFSSMPTTSRTSCSRFSLPVPTEKWNHTSPYSTKAVSIVE
jgi:hypothetical protein